VSRWPVLAPYLAQEIIAIALAVESGTWWEDDQRPWEGGASEGFQPLSGE
jgi:hypothetical protein